LEGEPVCHRIDLSCYDSFASLRTTLSSLFRVNSFHILYQTIMNASTEVLKEEDDDDKWSEFLIVVKKITVKPFSVTPELKNLLW